MFEDTEYQFVSSNNAPRQSCHSALQALKPGTDLLSYWVKFFQESVSIIGIYDTRYESCYPHNMEVCLMVGNLY